MHHFIDGALMFITLRVFVAGTINELIEKIVKPENVREWLKAPEVVAKNIIKLIKRYY
jgi:hypothetical protein